MSARYFIWWYSTIFSFLLGFYFSMCNIEKPKAWSYFVFAQQWPPAACYDAPHGKCSIPKGVDEWTVHGLWPTSDKGYPSFCNSSWPFNPQSIRNILQSLEVKWPNIYPHTSATSFWKHEWQKHGTCAATLSQFDSELKYFQRSLELHDELNIYDIIRRIGITPSADQPVLLKYIENAIQLEVENEVKLFCKKHKQYKFPLLTTIYICLDKNEQAIDCDKIHESVCDNTHVLYLPFNTTVSNEVQVLNESFI